MSRKDLWEAFSYVDQELLDLVEQERVDTKQEKQKKTVAWSRWATLAAGICLLLLVPFGVYAQRELGAKSLYDLALPMTADKAGSDGMQAAGTVEESAEAMCEYDLAEDETYDLGEPRPETMEEKETSMVTSDGVLESAKNDRLISLAGYQDSPEAMALAEWEQFLDSYDRDGRILAAIGNEPTGLEERYGQYSVYTKEMADKLDTIAEKYSLKLHSEINVVSPKELDYRVGDSFIEGNYERAYGYIYEDGSFQFDGTFRPGQNTEEPAAEGIDFQFRRVVKGTLDEVVLAIGNPDIYEQIPYFTADGEVVVLAMAPHKSLIYGDFGSCFVSVNVLSGSDNGMTQSILEEMAETIDFSGLKNVQKPDMRGDR